jgi:hypothetical protein
LHGQDVPDPADWDQGVVSEEENGKMSGTWVPAKEFGPRFLDILSATTRWWVNVNLRGIRDGVVYFVVEFISAEEGHPRVPPEKIAVALSGPAIPPPWHKIDGAARR